ncbi:MAG: phage tail spike protein [Romboutsia timonensis]
MLFILNRQEKVVGVLKNSGKNSVPFFNDLLTEDLATGSETFEFTTVSKNGIGQHLVVGNFIAFKKGQSYKLFQIMQTEEDHQDELYISVYAECAGLQLINSAFRGAKIISASFDRVIRTLLSDTSWNVGALPYGLATTYDLDIEQASVYSLLQTYAQKYGVELEFRVEINRGKISKKYVDGYYSRGKVTGKRFTYERDIEGIVRKTDATELYTALIGKGNNSISFKDVTVDGIDKPMGQDFVANQSAYEKYNNNGYHIVGIYECDTDDAKDLLRKTHKRLLEVSEPKVEYDVSVLLLCELLGEKWNEVAIGDTISVFDNAFYPPIMVSARVSKLQTSMTDKNANKCTLANFIEVKSNITAEMRKIASQLQGYVDNRFPIGSSDIQDGAVGTDQISDIYTQTITTDILRAGKVETEKLIAQEAEITNAKIENLKADLIEADKIIAGSIEAVEGKFDKITADLINADEIITDSITAVEGKFDKVSADLVEADKVIAGTVTANKAEFDKLEAKVGQIDTLVSGNISSENIQTGGITGDNLNMATIFVRDANILDLSASKLTAGEINTSQIVIASEDGGMRLVGSTQQFIDENDRIRIQLGKDANGDFDFYILAENGDILFNTRGITGNAIENGLIKENMVSDGAIGGKKINWSSFVTEFNKDSNTHKLNSSKVLLDGTNQTLDVHFSQLSETVNGNTSQIDSNTTQINTQQGRINTLIQDTTIVKDGQNLKLKDEYSKLEQTVKGISTTVGEHETKWENNSETIKQLQSKISQNTDSISLKVESTYVEQKFSDVYDHVSEVQYNVINSYESALEATKERITTSVSEMYAKKDDVSSIEETLSSMINQTASDISLIFNKSTNEVKNDLQGFKEQVTSYIRFNSDGMELGKQGSKFKTRLNNEKLAFLQNEEEVAYISNNKMYITDAEIKNQLTLGSYAFVPRSNGNLSLKWIK